MPSICQRFDQALAKGFFRRAVNLLTIVLAGVLASTTVHAAIATFTLVDKTNLTPGTYKIYVTGFSTAGPYVLQQNGSWGSPALPTAPAIATLPCYEFGTSPGQISQIQIDSTQTAISARVYYFVVTDLARFPSCTPTSGTGLFNQQSVTNAFTYTSTFALTTPTPNNVTATNFPAWTFSEIGASATSATIDLSQVDFFAFPMNTVATVTAGNPDKIGNPVGSTDNPGDVVNNLSIYNSYTTFVSTLGAGAYLDLAQPITTAGSPVPQTIIENPGGYLGRNTGATQASGLNTIFDVLIGKLWTTTAPPTLTLDTGGLLGSVPQDTFTSSIVTINYPGSTVPVKAMKFTGTAASGFYIAYVFSPKDYPAGCAAVTPTPNCSVPTSTGFQVFAGAGALGAPPDNTIYSNLNAAGQLSANAAALGGATSYNQVATRLTFLISGAMNRGVALVTCPRTYTWQCWQDETYWYPTTTSLTFPDISQNLFSQWIHTATIGGKPMFVRPPNAVKSASSAPGGGTLMGMAYGFSNDENPTPPATNPPQPEVPSKMDQTVQYVSGGSITFGPWVTPSATPTLLVTVTGSGSVTSSPAGINCGTTCSFAYPAGTNVILTASPSGGAFVGWSGACTGTSTTCSVTVSATTIVNAQFAGAATFGLNVLVSGAGTVTSVPSGISCGATCSAQFSANTSVTLTASATGGSVFAGWSGACSGASTTCMVTMSQALSVGASFVTSAQYTLTVVGASGGIVTTAQGGINCGTTCVAGYAAGTMVNVLAYPNPGFQFTGWSGACTGTNTCDLTMNANQTVQATFAAVPLGQFSLTVHDFGSGTVTSLPAGVNCGVVCSAVYAAGTSVTLVPTASTGYVFVGWTGACSGAGSCVVLMGSPQDVSATFVPNAVPVATEIPTLGEWALLLMSLMIMSVAGWHLRSRALRTCKLR